MSAAFVLTLFSLPLVDDCNVSNSIGFARSGRKARKSWTCRSICKLEMLQYYMYSILYYFNIFSTVSIFLVPNGVDCIKGGLHIPIRGGTQKRCGTACPSFSFIKSEDMDQEQHFPNCNQTFNSKKR